MIYAVIFQYNTSSSWVSSWLVWTYKNRADAQEAMKEEREKSVLQHNYIEDFDDYEEKENAMHAMDRFNWDSYSIYIDKKEIQ